MRRGRGRRSAAAASDQALPRQPRASVCKQTGGAVLAVIAAAALAFVAGAAPAAPERVVNFYNWADYVAPTVFDDFTKETGIAVRYDTLDGNDTLEAKLFAGQSGYDVVVPTAYFLAPEIKAGLFQKLDKSKLPNLVHLWPAISDRLASYDPGNLYAVNYMWGTTGIGYNVNAVRQILGPAAAIDSWDEVFDPAKFARFKDCGIYLLDSSDDVMSAALHYLHLDPNTSDPAALEQATALLIKIRPYVRKFHSLEYLNALATGEICFAIAFSGDVKQAQRAAAAAHDGIAISYAIPKEGAQLWLDNLAIPSDAPHLAEAHMLINYLLRPEVAAKNTNYVFYANGDQPTKLIDSAILDDPTIYPDAATMARLYTLVAHDQKTERLMNRLWERIKTGD